MGPDPTPVWPQIGDTCHGDHDPYPQCVWNGSRWVRDPQDGIQPCPFESSN